MWSGVESGSLCMTLTDQHSKSPPPQVSDHTIDSNVRVVPFTSSCTYPITTHADCMSMNLIYQLHCTQYNAFYIGETCRSLSDHMNGHSFAITVLNPNLPVTIHTQNPTRSPSKNVVSMLVSITPSPPDSTSINPPSPIPTLP